MLSWFFFCQIEVLQTNGNVRLWWWIEIHHKNIFLLFLRFHEKTIQLLSFPFFTPPSNTKSVLFFVNSFRFTLHFYVTKAKVSNKPVIWHFFRQNNLQMYNTHSTSFYISPNNLNIAQDWIFFLNPFFVIFASRSLTRATYLVDYITTMRQRKNCFWSCCFYCCDKIASISVENTLQHYHSGI